MATALAVVVVPLTQAAVTWHGASTGTSATAGSAATAEAGDRGPASGAASGSVAAPAPQATGRTPVEPPVAGQPALEPPAGSSHASGTVLPDLGRDAQDAEPVTPLPPRSGAGRRVVFSESAQRVWLVEAGERVRRTYLVSGSLHDNLDPGTYAVFSRSERAWGIDDSGTMRWFVRFTHGPNAAIGFHDIPVDDGRPVQTVAELGTPRSHGCIRQRTADAKALWAFAPLGTTVVVVA